MNIPISRQLWFLGLVAMVLVPCLAQQYTVTELGRLPCCTDSWGTGINSFGQVSGYSGDRHGRIPDRAFLWDGKLVDLGVLLGARSSRAIAVNDNGQIAGNSAFCEGVRCENHVFFWQDGQMADWGPGSAHGLNNSGQVVGLTAGPLGEAHAALWQDGDMIDLHPFVTFGGIRSFALAINNLGDVVGSSELPSTSHAFLYSDGEVVDLGTLPGDQSSAAYAVNDLRQVVGVSGRVGEQRHIFLWEDDRMMDLGIGSPSGINNLGQIVGDGRLWTDGAWYSLSDLIGPDPVGITVSPAFINDAGQIVANGTAELVPGRIRFASWLLTPIRQSQ